MNLALSSRLVRLIVAAGATVALTLGARTAGAQITPAAGSTPPDDTPSIKLGAVIFADYTYQQAPQITDADGNKVNLSAFNVSRAYINVTGNVSHIVAFRITADVSRETGTGSSLNGSLTFRMKYGFMAINLDDWMWKGSWVRLGIQQTPYVDWAEGIYRYRFQGTIFTEREGYLTSSDAAVSFHTAFPGNYGDVHVGIYNGDGYSKAEANDQKAIQIRGSFRPLPMHSILRGLRVTGFYDADKYIRSGDKKRAIFNVTFEHKYLNAGFDYLATKDRTSIAKTDIVGKGWSIWGTPRKPFANGSSIEALLRYDSMKRDTSATYENQVNERIIAGVAYWFPKQGSVSAALLLDYDQYTFANFVAPQPTQKRWAVHGLISF
jgi:hypothetical protein